MGRIKENNQALNSKMMTESSYVVSTLLEKGYSFNEIFTITKIAASSAETMAAAQFSALLINNALKGN